MKYGASKWGHSCNTSGHVSWAFRINCGRNWKCLELQHREALKSCKQSLMGQSIMEIEVECIWKYSQGVILSPQGLRWEYVNCLVVLFGMLICFGLFLIWTFLDRGAVWGHCGNSRMQMRSCGSRLMGLGFRK